MRCRNPARGCEAASAAPRRTPAIAAAPAPHPRGRSPPRSAGPRIPASPDRAWGRKGFAQADGSAETLYSPAPSAFLMKSSLVLAAALIAAACTSGSEAPRLALSPCRLAGLEASAQCATYEVWENRETRTGRRIELNVAVIPAHMRTHEPDPIFVRAGGPGQGAVSLAAQVMPLFARLNDSRDLVFLDQRGTGASNPLDCEDDEQQSLQSVF